MKNKNYLKMSPMEFIHFLKKENINRFYFVYDKQKQIVKTSHPQLNSIVEFIQNDTRDFMQHEGLFFQILPKYDVLAGIFVHRTNRGQGAGGVRYWSYNTIEDFLRDGLRLAKGMTRKNALAGLWWGGGKGVMTHNPDIDKKDKNIRKSIYQEFGKFTTSVQGCYITAEDVGTNVMDMAEIFSKTRFTTCIPHEFGGSGNPSISTARGVICGMEAALEFTNQGAVSGKTIAIQGMGNVASSLIKFLFEKNVKKIIACDINEELVKKLQTELAGKNFEAYIVSPDDASIFQTKCDILSFNATGGVLNPKTIPLIKTKIICGAANNQLENPYRDDKLLYDKKIIYIPDFLTNRMGIVNCANEQYGYVANDPFIEKHLNKTWEHSIYKMTLKVLDKSFKTGEPTGKIAMKMADELSLENHPIFGHRGQQIIDSLVAAKWHKK